MSGLNQLSAFAAARDELFDAFLQFRDLLTRGFDFFGEL